MKVFLRVAFLIFQLELGILPGYSTFHYLYVWKCLYKNQMVHHNHNFKLFLLYNSFNIQGSKINKDDVFSRPIIRKLLSYYKFNKFASWYSPFNFRVRLCLQLILDVMLIYCLNPWEQMKTHGIINVNKLRMITIII